MPVCLAGAILCVSGASSPHTPLATSWIGRAVDINSVVGGRVARILSMPFYERRRRAWRTSPCGIIGAILLPTLFGSIMFAHHHAQPHSSSINPDYHHPPPRARRRPNGPRCLNVRCFYALGMRCGAPRRRFVWFTTAYAVPPLRVRALWPPLRQR